MYLYYEVLAERLEETPRKALNLYTQVRDEAALINLNLDHKTSPGVRRRIAFSLVQLGVRLDPAAAEPRAAEEAA